MGDEGGGSIQRTSVYDSIGGGYSTQRVPEFRIAARIRVALGDARTVCNVGAGAGSYEPENPRVFAVEPSVRMISQRESPRGVVRAVAERLPFADACFDAAMVILSLHHWRDVPLGLAELCRVAPRRIIFAFDPERQDRFWLVRDYLPEMALEWRRALSIEAIITEMGGGRVEVVPVPWDCTDGFQAAYWRRPERYLEPAVRASISTLAQLPAQVVETAMQRLAADLASGAWTDRNAEILESDEMDYGYRLIVSPG